MPNYWDNDSPFPGFRKSDPVPEETNAIVLHSKDLTLEIGESGSYFHARRETFPAITHYPQYSPILYVLSERTGVLEKFEWDHNIELVAASNCYEAQYCAIYKSENYQTILLKIYFDKM